MVQNTKIKMMKITSENKILEFGFIIIEYQRNHDKLSDETKKKKGKTLLYYITFF